MTIGMVQQTVTTPQLISAASLLVRLAHPGEASLHRALERAEGRLMSQAWRIDAGILQIASHSTPGDVQTTDGAYCSCVTTRGVCWHIAAHALVTTLTAAGVHPVADLPLPATLDSDELPTSFLDGDFSAFDDMSLTLDIRPAEPVSFEEVDILPVARPRRGVWYHGEYFSDKQLARLEDARQAARSAEIQAAADEMYAA